eukprot:gene1301-1643_t
MALFAGGGARDVGFDAKLEALAALCDLASTTTGVDHPLCLDCVEQLKDELAAQVTELEGEITAYSSALEDLEAQPPQELSKVSKVSRRRPDAWAGAAGFARRQGKQLIVFS